MKQLIVAILFVSLFSACKNQNTKIVQSVYVDSLTKNYTIPNAVKDNEADMLFWKNRIDPKQPRQVNESKYASTLVTRFHQFGDIQDLKAAEAIYKAINKTYNNKLASPYVALTSTAMQQHRFTQADTLLQTAKTLGIDGFTNSTLSFDVNFELGRYQFAQNFLKKLRKNKDYSYYFRKSKMDHLNMAMDSAIDGMYKAANLAKNTPYLQGVALSNAADLCIHAGELQKAGELYKKCIKLNPIDFHSILGLGWLALVHDKNDTLAQKMFAFVGSKSKLPDAYFKLYQMAQQRGNKAEEKMYAREFEAKATDTLYGKMYNKYLIEIYAGVLGNTAKAELLAKNELSSRANPATYAWYAYALFMNNKKDEAYKVFSQHVSDQPLEGLELFYMGKMMKGLGKGYNAMEFFKAANKNRFDLSPDMDKELQKGLEE